MFEMIFPVKGEWTYFDLNQESLAFSKAKANPLLDPNFCDKWVKKLHRSRKVKFSYGGYLEDRSSLWRGHYHKPGEFVHLGTDFNVPAGTVVLSPFDALVVDSYFDEDQNGGWGGRVILATEDYFFIVAHLEFILPRFTRVSKGDGVGVVAPPQNNGGWYQHCHWQVVSNRKMNDLTRQNKLSELDGYSSNYPGIEEDFPDLIKLIRGD